jgi:hypothetical protein
MTSRGRGSVPQSEPDRPRQAIIRGMDWPGIETDINAYG